MRLRSFAAFLPLIAACSDESPPLQPAPPTDRNFTATVNDQPVVGGTQRYACVIRSRDADRMIVLTFSDDLGHDIQIGIERGDDTPGPRAIITGMATATGLAYGPPRDAHATLTLVLPTETGVVVSGRFEARFEVATAAPGVSATSPLIVRDALFEQVECLDPELVNASARSH